MDLWYILLSEASFIYVCKIHTHFCIYIYLVHALTLLYGIPLYEYLHFSFFLTEFTCHLIQSVYSSVLSSIFTGLCNHHHNERPFCPLKEIVYPLAITTHLFPLPRSPKQPLIYKSSKFANSGPFI